MCVRVCVCYLPCPYQSVGGVRSLCTVYSGWIRAISIRSPPFCHFFLLHPLLLGSPVGVLPRVLAQGTFCGGGLRAPLEVAKQIEDCRRRLRGILWRAGLAMTSSLPCAFPKPPGAAVLFSSSATLISCNQPAILDACECDELLKVATFVGIALR